MTHTFTPLFSLSSPWRYLAAGLIMVVLGAVWLASVTAFAAESVGTVAKKRMDVYGTPPDGSRERVFPRHDVVYGELIETSGGGAVLVRLSDDSELYIGERASLTIDDFVYDPQTQTGKATYNFAIGTLRYVSGDMQETEISILTPNANIGIRGSEAVIFVTPEKQTIVNVIEGRFSVRSRDRPDLPAVDVEAGQNVSLSGVTDFSPVGQGVKMPEYSHDPADKVPDYSDDFYDLQSSGGFDRARDGRDVGDRSTDTGGGGHDDGGGHID